MNDYDDPYCEHRFTMQLAGERHEFSFWGKRAPAEAQARAWVAAEGGELVEEQEEPK